MKCSQCERSAIYKANGAPFCLSCYERVDRIRQQEFDRHAALYNIALDQFDAIAPFGPRMNRIPVARRVEVAGPSMNNIHVHAGNIGVLNTGTVQRIDATVSSINSSGEKEIARAIADLTEQVANLGDIGDAVREEVLQLVSALADEAAEPKEKRRGALIKPVFERLATVLQASANSVALWERFGPVIKAYFGL